MGNTIPVAAAPQVDLRQLMQTDIPQCLYQELIGKGKFMKTVRAKYDPRDATGRLFPGESSVSKLGNVVIKIYYNRSDSKDVKSRIVYGKEQLALICRLFNLRDHPNIFPYQRFEESPSMDAAFLLRQHFTYNLYDRINSRPFLSNVEKLWLIFQMMRAVEQAHAVGVRHGDIKLENFAVTSFNWLFLTDFATFKPTYIADDSPADFAFFFESGTRDRCYISPERLLKPKDLESNKNIAGTPFSSPVFVSPASLEPAVGGTGDANRHNSVPEEGSSSSGTAFDPSFPLPCDPSLKETMDIFSLGCCITELVLDGADFLDRAALLRYRSAYSSVPKVSSTPNLQQSGVEGSNPSIRTSGDNETVYNRNEGVSPCLSEQSQFDAAMLHYSSRSYSEFHPLRVPGVSAAFTNIDPSGKLEASVARMLSLDPSSRGSVSQHLRYLSSGPTDADLSGGVPIYKSGENVFAGTELFSGTSSMRPVGDNTFPPYFPFLAELFARLIAPDASSSQKKILALAISFDTLLAQVCGSVDPIGSELLSRAAAAECTGSPLLTDWGAELQEALRLRAGAGADLFNSTSSHCTGSGMSVHSRTTPAEPMERVEHQCASGCLCGLVEAARAVVSAVSPSPVLKSVPRSSENEDLSVLPPSLQGFFSSAAQSALDASLESLWEWGIPSAHAGNANRAGVNAASAAAPTLAQARTPHAGPMALAALVASEDAAQYLEHLSAAEDFNVPFDAPPPLRWCIVPGAEAGSRGVALPLSPPSPLSEGSVVPVALVSCTPTQSQPADAESSLDPYSALLAEADGLLSRLTGVSRDEDNDSEDSDVESIESSEIPQESTNDVKHADWALQLRPIRDPRARTSGICILVPLLSSLMRSMSVPPPSLALLLLILLSRLLPYLPNSCILDSVVPLAVALLSESGITAAVRAAAIRLLASAVRHCTSLPRADAPIFLHFIMPAISRVVADTDPGMQCALAACLPVIFVEARRLTDSLLESGVNSSSNPSVSSIGPFSGSTVSPSVGSSSGLIPADIADPRILRARARALLERWSLAADAAAQVLAQRLVMTDPAVLSLFAVSEAFKGLDAPLPSACCDGVASSRRTHALRLLQESRQPTRFSFLQASSSSVDSSSFDREATVIGVQEFVDFPNVVSFGLKKPSIHGFDQPKLSKLLLSRYPLDEAVSLSSLLRLSAAVRSLPASLDSAAARTTLMRSPQLVDFARALGPAAVESALLPLFISFINSTPATVFLSVAAPVVVPAVLPLLAAAEAALGPPPEALTPLALGWLGKGSLCVDPALHCSLLDAVARLGPALPRGRAGLLLLPLLEAALASPSDPVVVHASNAILSLLRPSPAPNEASTAQETNSGLWEQPGIVAPEDALRSLSSFSPLLVHPSGSIRRALTKVFVAVFSQLVLGYLHGLQPLPADAAPAQQFERALAASVRSTSVLAPVLAPFLCPAATDALWPLICRAVASSLSPDPAAGGQRPRVGQRERDRLCEALLQKALLPPLNRAHLVLLQHRTAIAQLVELWPQLSSVVGPGVLLAPHEHELYLSSSIAGSDKSAIPFPPSSSLSSTNLTPSSAISKLAPLCVGPLPVEQGKQDGPAGREAQLVLLQNARAATMNAFLRLTAGPARLSLSCASRLSSLRLRALGRAVRTYAASCSCALPLYPDLRTRAARDRILDDDVIAAEMESEENFHGSVSLGSEGSVDGASAVNSTVNAVDGAGATDVPVPRVFFGKSPSSVTLNSPVSYTASTDRTSPAQAPTSSHGEDEQLLPPLVVRNSQSSNRQALQTIQLTSSLQDAPSSLFNALAICSTRPGESVQLRPYTQEEQLPLPVRALTVPDQRFAPAHPAVQRGVRVRTRRAAGISSLPPHSLVPIEGPEVAERLSLANLQRRHSHEHHEESSDEGEEDEEVFVPVILSPNTAAATAPLPEDSLPVASALRSLALLARARSGTIKNTDLYPFSKTAEPEDDGNQVMIPLSSSFSATTGRVSSPRPRQSVSLSLRSQSHSSSLPRSSSCSFSVSFSLPDVTPATNRLSGPTALPRKPVNLQLCGYSSLEVAATERQYWHAGGRDLRRLHLAYGLWNTRLPVRQPQPLPPAVLQSLGVTGASSGAFYYDSAAIGRGGSSGSTGSHAAVVVAAAEALSIESRGGLGGDATLALPLDEPLLVYNRLAVSTASSNGVNIGSVNHAPRGRRSVVGASSSSFAQTADVPASTAATPPLPIAADEVAGETEQWKSSRLSSADDDDDLIFARSRALQREGFERPLAAGGLQPPSAPHIHTYSSSSLSTSTSSTSLLRLSPVVVASQYVAASLTAAVSVLSASSLAAVPAVGASSASAVLPPGIIQSILGASGSPGPAASSGSSSSSLQGSSSSAPAPQGLSSGGIAVGPGSTSTTSSASLTPSTPGPLGARQSAFPDGSGFAAASAADGAFADDLFAVEEVAGSPEFARQAGLMASYSRKLRASRAEPNSAALALAGVNAGAGNASNAGNYPAVVHDVAYFGAGGLSNNNSGGNINAAASAMPTATPSVVQVDSIIAYSSLTDFVGPHSAPNAPSSSIHRGIARGSHTSTGSTPSSDPSLPLASTTNLSFLASLESLDFADPRRAHVLQRRLRALDVPSLPPPFGRLFRPNSVDSVALAAAASFSTYGQAGHAAAAAAAAAGALSGSVAGSGLNAIMLGAHFAPFHGLPLLLATPNSTNLVSGAREQGRSSLAAHVRMQQSLGPLGIPTVPLIAHLFRLSSGVPAAHAHAVGRACGAGGGLVTSVPMLKGAKAVLAETVGNTFSPLRARARADRALTATVRQLLQSNQDASSSPQSLSSSNNNLQLLSWAPVPAPAAEDLSRPLDVGDGTGLLGSSRLSFLALERGWGDIVGRDSHLLSLSDQPETPPNAVNASTSTNPSTFSSSVEGFSASVKVSSSVGPEVVPASAQALRGSVAQVDFSRIDPSAVADGSSVGGAGTSSTLSGSGRETSVHSAQSPSMTASKEDSWGSRPRGLLLVQCVGHRAPVRALAVCQNHSFFVSAGDDGLVLLWDTRTLDRDVAPRAAAVYAGFVGARGPANPNAASRGRMEDSNPWVPSYNPTESPKLTSLVMLDNSSSFAVGSAGGEVHVVRVELAEILLHALTQAGGSQTQHSNGRTALQGVGSGPGLYCTHRFRFPAADGPVIALRHQESSLASTLFVALGRGILRILDLRRAAETAVLRLPPVFGTLTALELSPCGSVAVIGTSRGVLVLVDLASCIVLKCWRISARAPVRALYTYIQLDAAGPILCPTGPGNKPIPTNTASPPPFSSEVPTPFLRSLCAGVSCGQEEVGFWNLETGQCTRVLRALPESVRSQNALKVPFLTEINVRSRGGEVEVVNPIRNADAVLDVLLREAGNAAAKAVVARLRRIIQRAGTSTSKLDQSSSRMNLRLTPPEFHTAALWAVEEAFTRSAPTGVITTLLAPLPTPVALSSLGPSDSVNSLNSAAAAAPYLMADEAAFASAGTSLSAVSGTPGAGSSSSAAPALSRSALFSLGDMRGAGAIRRADGGFVTALALRPLSGAASHAETVQGQKTSRTVGPGGILGILGSSAAEGLPVWLLTGDSAGFVRCWDFDRPRASHTVCGLSVGCTRDGYEGLVVVPPAPTSLDAISSSVCSSCGRPGAKDGCVCASAASSTEIDDLFTDLQQMATSVTGDDQDEALEAALALALARLGLDHAHCPVEVTAAFSRALRSLRVRDEAAAAAGTQAGQEFLPDGFSYKSRDPKAATVALRALRLPLRLLERLAYAHWHQRAAPVRTQLAMPAILLRSTHSSSSVESIEQGLKGPVSIEAKHSGVITAMAWVDNANRLLLTASKDGTIMVWK